MNIYVASSWRNAYQPGVVQALRYRGYEVYDFRNPEADNHGFAWAHIDEHWESWSVGEFTRALEHPVAVEGFKNDSEGLSACDMVVLVLPSGRSAHTEAGWAAGQGKPVVVYSPVPCEPELMYGLFDAIVGTQDELFRQVRRLGGERFRLNI